MLSYKKVDFENFASVIIAFMAQILILPFLEILFLYIHICYLSVSLENPKVCIHTHRGCQKNVKKETI